MIKIQFEDHPCFPQYYPFIRKGFVPQLVLQVWYLDLKTIAISISYGHLTLPQRKRRECLIIERDTQSI